MDVQQVLAVRTERKRPCFGVWVSVYWAYGKIAVVACASVVAGELDGQVKYAVGHFFVDLSLFCGTLFLGRAFRRA